jgi:iron(III) transport system ATP-binding protein
MQPVPITIRSLRKQFGATVAVDDISLDIPGGSLFFLLGPSGCGKTTLLRMIAGFTDPTAGSLHFGDREVTHTPPHQRNTGMVFQGYALWPHMTVRQNVAFGLDVRKLAATEKNERVDKALHSVQLHPLADRKPNQLSGGQQQRVALARALVIEPTVLLLDEPLSNLDAKLRLEMRSSIREVCKRTGITAVYVTHDQHEALSMADQVAVLQTGKLMQLGPPRELYERPANRFVADFLGETNFIPAVVPTEKVDSRSDGKITMTSPIGPLSSTVWPDDLPATGNVTVSIRPEAIRLLPSGAAGDASTENHFRGKRVDTMYLGSTAQYRLALDGDVTLKALEINPQLEDTHAHGDELALQIDPDDVVILRD